LLGSTTHTLLLVNLEYLTGAGVADDCSGTGDMTKLKSAALAVAIAVALPGAAQAETLKVLTAALSSKSCWR
jgi:hypothetical protein